MIRGWRCSVQGLRDLGHYRWSASRAEPNPSLVGRRDAVSGYRLRGAEAPVEDEKTVVGRVERAKAEQRSRSTCKPRSDHPWRRPFKAEAAGTAAG